MDWSLNTLDERMLAFSFAQAGEWMRRAEWMAPFGLGKARMVG